MAVNWSETAYRQQLSPIKKFHARRLEGGCVPTPSVSQDALPCPQSPARYPWRAGIQRRGIQSKRLR